MSVADKIGMGPHRKETMLHDGRWLIEVTPNPMFGKQPTLCVKLSSDQYRRYQDWRKGMFIQDALPELPASVREMLMTGLGDDAFHNFAIAQDEEDD